MIIKTIRWKSGGFQRLVEYVGRHRKDERAFEFFHNMLPTRDLRDVAKELKANDVHRNQRKAKTSMYHEILSFHKDDSVHLHTSTLEDLAQHYLKLRAPRGIGYSAPHFDTDHVHIHVVFGGVELRSARTLRMNNRTFTTLRRRMEAYQQRNYPDLFHSIVHIDKAVRGKELNSEKESQKSRILEGFRECDDIETLLDRIESEGLDLALFRFDAKSGRFDLEIDFDDIKQTETRMRELKALRVCPLPERENVKGFGE